ncbi:MAG: hypothetical protein L6R38_003514 [Xanthoria sp. 2 TBL-2021]|nr:MAG: hypothetical protein L6R38_003514 [Xanthoria sp. 2 TBL-2021]
MAHNFSGADDRASTPTNGDDPADAAPEVDHAVQAPQPGRDRAGPEVVPGLGSQVCSNTSPPEAIMDNFVKIASELALGKEASSARKQRRILIITILAVLILVTIALSVGLGVGLKQQKRDVAPPASSNFPSYTTSSSSIWGSNIQVSF